MKTLIIFILFLLGINALSQDIELLRQKGYEAKTSGDITVAILNYKKILSLNPQDYDAKLAVANLYFTQNKYDSALTYYALIYNTDQKDVEALNGFGRCYFRMEAYHKSALYYTKSIRLLPSYIPPYFNLAQDYIALNELDSAIYIYKKIIQQDSTYAEAWAGLGKMNYWQNKPYDAIKNYEKASILDPQNEQYQAEITNLLNVLAFSNKLKLLYVNEKESNYEIDAIITTYTLSKRVSNHWNVSFSFLLDHSNRNFYTVVGDTTRWFDNSAMAINWLRKNSSIKAYGGFSVSDKTITAYGLTWMYSFTLSGVKIRNILNANYEYFYYWNKVGRNKINDNIQISYKKIKLEGSYLFGVVTENIIADFYNDLYGIAENPHTMYSISLSYEIVSVPKISLSVNHSYLNYTYKSPLYYTPYERKLTGPSTSIYFSKNGFYVYSSFAYNIGSEVFYEEKSSAGQGSAGLKTNIQNIDSWNMDAEIGYIKNNITISGGVSRFYNPFYENFMSFLSFNLRL